MPTINSPTPDATTLTKGKVQLAGDLAGTASAPTLSTTAITLGYTEITTSATTTSTTTVQATGLSVTVTIPAGGRKIRVSAYIPRALHNLGTGYFVGELWDGTVGSGTRLVDSPYFQSGTANSGGNLFLSRVVTPSAGSKTYNVGFYGTTANTTAITVSATSPAYIHVEAV